MVSIGAAWSGARSARRARPARESVVIRLVTVLASVLPSWPRVRTTVLQLAGFAFLDAAAWRWSLLAGLAAIGVSLFVLEMLTGEPPKRGAR
jgi:hypothetical protein